MPNQSLRYPGLHNPRRPGPGRRWCWAPRNCRPMVGVGGRGNPEVWPLPRLPSDWSPRVNWVAVLAPGFRTCLDGLRTTPRSATQAKVHSSPVLPHPPSRKHSRSSRPMLPPGLLARMQVSYLRKRRSLSSKRISSGRTPLERLGRMQKSEIPRHMSRCQARRAMRSGIRRSGYPGLRN